MNDNNEMEVQPEQLTEKKDDKPERSTKLELYDWFQCIVSAIVCGVLIFVFLGRIVNVNGTSMYSTLYNGDMVLCSNLFYTPKQGDIVVFRCGTGYFDHSLVKRIIATEGQTVDIDFTTGTVYVDGVALDEPYTYEPAHDSEDFTEPVTVPEGCLFVMGDNRNGSTDSRDHRVGFVDKRDIIGKVYMIIIPGEDIYGNKSYSRIGSVY